MTDCLENDNGHFSDVSKEAGIYGSLIGFGLGISVGDVNGDNWPDIYVSNDFLKKDYLYINQKNGKFKEDLKDRMGHISLSGPRALTLQTSTMTGIWISLPLICCHQKT